MPAALSDLEQRAVSALLDSDARESVLTMHDPSRHRVMLAVAGAVGFAAVFPSVGTKGAAEPTILPHSVDHDSVLCLTTADVDWDGEDEILVGTFDARLLVYRATSSTEDGLPHYTLVLERRFMYPVYSIQVGDFNGDGVDEIIAVTSFGIHVLQPNLVVALRDCINTSQLVNEILELEAELASLRSDVYVLPADDVVNAVD